MQLQPVVHSFLKQTVPADSMLVVAVSGGADSLALAHMLVHCWEREQLVIAHFHHGLRDSADSDATFVQKQAQQWQVAHHIKHGDVRSFADKVKISIETAARQLRYQFLAEVAISVGSDTIVTAHHADDQAETVIMNLLRGSGLRGLRGMLPNRALPNQPQLRLLRPLLTVSRQQIEAYCQTHRLQSRDDESNRDLTFTRNRIRHQLLPLLTDINPQAKQHLSEVATIARADDRLLEELAQEAFREVVRERSAETITLDRPQWQQLPLALQRRTLRITVEKLAKSAEINFPTLESARQLALSGTTGQQATLTATLNLHLSYDKIIFAPVGEEQFSECVPQFMGDLPIPLPVPTQITLNDGWILQAEWDSTSLDAIQANDDRWQVWVVTEKPLFLRSRQAGERIQPLGMGGKHAKLKEVMINRKVPASQRSRWPIVATEDHAIWLVGHLLDQRAAVLSDTIRKIHLSCLRK